MRRAVFSPRMALLGACASSALTLTGCPLSDEYSIDPNYGSGGQSFAAGGKGGASANGGESGSGGESSFGGTGGGGIASTNSTGGVAECTASTCARACCDGVCVDLRNDANNCGSCGTVCSSGRTCSVGTCTAGWIATASPPASFVPREKAAYASFSGKVFVFGGLDENGKELNTSAIYDPALDSWQLGAVDANTPSARELATAVWTGSAVLVFGGRNGAGSAVCKDAALYDPVANRWTKTSDNDTARAAPIGAVYNGMAVFWSGLSANLIPLAGSDRYKASTDSWWASVTTNGPSRLGHTACAGVGANFYAYGGIDSTISKTDKAYRYSFGTNTWSTLSRGPSARWDAFGATDGTRFFVWGGRDESSLKSDGAAYETQWITMGIAGAPTPRYAPLRESGFTFSIEGLGFVLLGGFDTSGAILHDGARYSTASDTWSSIPAWASEEDHAFGVAASTGTEIVMFGGRDGTRLTNTGERYAF